MGGRLRPLGARKPAVEAEVVGLVAAPEQEDVGPLEGRSMAPGEAAVGGRLGGGDLAPGPKLDAELVEVGLEHPGPVEVADADRRRVVDEDAETVHGDASSCGCRW